jgi:hypothetical protein
MSLIKSYLSVLNEDTKKTSNVVADNTGELEGSEKAKNFVKDSGPDANCTVETPVEGKSQADVTPEESAPKSVKSESTNPFDVLYNKVLAQENWELEEAEEEEEAGDDKPLEFAGLGEPEGTAAHEHGEELGLEAVLAHLQGAVEALEKLVSSAVSDEEEVTVGEEGSEVAEPVVPEAVEAEVLGHALKDSEKLSAGLTKGHEVKGAVPVTKKAGSVVKGPKVDGEPEELKGNPEELHDKSKQNVGGVTPGKSLFAQG